jgi:hypothetical protein
MRKGGRKIIRPVVATSENMIRQHDELIGTVSVRTHDRGGPRVAEGAYAARSA